MTAFVDTNVLIRFLTNDPPQQATRAQRFLAGADELVLTDVVLAEVVYVLESFYGVGRRELAAAVRALLALRSIVTVTHTATLYRTVQLYETLRLDFADAYLAAIAESSDTPVVASFDREISKVTTVERIEP